MDRHFSDYDNKEYWDKACKEVDRALRQECYERPSAFRTAILEAAIKTHGIKIAGLN